VSPTICWTMAYAHCLPALKQSPLRELLSN